MSQKNITATNNKIFSKEKKNNLHFFFNFKFIIRTILISTTYHWSTIIYACSDFSFPLQEGVT